MLLSVKIFDSMLTKPMFNWLKKFFLKTCTLARRSEHSGRPARWVWGVKVLDEWEVLRCVHLPSTRPDGGGSSPCCPRCWSRPRSVAAPPPHHCRWKKGRRRSETTCTALMNTYSQSMAWSSPWDGRPQSMNTRAKSRRFLHHSTASYQIYLCPFRAAWWRGVYPVLSTQFTLGPLQIL